MIKKVFGLLFIACLMVSCQNVDRKVRLASAFVEELKRGTENAVLIKEYMNISDPAAEPLAFLNYRLNGFREKIRTMDTIRVSSHNGHKIESLIITEGGRENVIFVSGKNQVFPILVKGNKIVAFSTINKGGKKVFLL
ncbi:MAG: hypothetical protein U0U09_08180 [Cyclobacteriaceae bacterium]